SESRPSLRLWNFLRPFWLGPRVAATTSEWRHPATIPCSESDVFRSGAGCAAVSVSVVRHFSADGLPNQSQSAHSLHHADRGNAGAPAHEIRQSLYHVSEFARQSSVLHQLHQCQSNSPGGNCCSGAQPNSLRISIRRRLQAESVDRQQQHSNGHEALPVWLLHAEVR